MRGILCGIDIGTYAVRVTIARYETETAGIVVIGTGEAVSQGVRHGYITNVHDASNSIRAAVKQAEKKANVTIRRAYVAIGGIGLGSDAAIGTAVITKSDGEITDHDIDRVLQDARSKATYADRKIILEAPILYKIDGKEAFGNVSGMHGVKLEGKILFISILEQHFDDALAAVTMAGIETIDVIPSPIAASMVAVAEKQKMVGCALVNIGAETTTIAVFEGGAPLSIHVFAIGSNDITNDIALGLRIPLDEAEHIKHGNHGDVTISRRKLDDIIEARLRDIFELIDQHLKKIRRSGLLPAGVILTGGGSHITLVESLSKNLLRLPSKIGSIETRDVTYDTAHDSGWLVSLGLCLIAKDAGVTPEISGGFGKLFVEFKKKTAAFLKQFVP